MTRAWIIAGAGLVIMAVALAYGFLAGGGWAEAIAIGAMPWGLVTYIDVYVGLLLVAGWISYRERSVPVAAAWIVLVLALGNLLACAYVLVALARSRGDMARFWLGTPA